MVFTQLFYHYLKVEQLVVWVEVVDNSLEKVALEGIRDDRELVEEDNPYLDY